MCQLTIKLLVHTSVRYQYIISGMYRCQVLQNTISLQALACFGYLFTSWSYMTYRLYIPLKKLPAIFCSRNLKGEALIVNPRPRGTVIYSVNHTSGIIGNDVMCQKPDRAYTNVTVEKCKYAEKAKCPEKDCNTRATAVYKIERVPDMQKRICNFWQKWFYFLYEMYLPFKKRI